MKCEPFALSLPKGFDKLRVNGCADLDMQTSLEKSVEKSGSDSNFPRNIHAPRDFIVLWLAQCSA